MIDVPRSEVLTKMHLFTDHCPPPPLENLHAWQNGHGRRKCMEKKGGTCGGFNDRERVGEAIDVVGDKRLKIYR